MSLEANNFRLGLFFLLAIAIFVTVLSWLGGWFEGGDFERYVCYFQWSVQGIEEGSSVRYYGVPVGKVKSIHVAPEGRLVQIILSIENKELVEDFDPNEMVARLDFVGITGLKVINITIDENDEGYVPQHFFRDPYPVIPVTRGSMETLEEGLRRLNEIMTQVDFEQLNDQTLQLMENLNTLLDSDKFDRISDSVIRTTNRIDTLAMVYIDLGRELTGLAEEIRDEAPHVATELKSMADDVSTLSASLDSLSERADGALLQGERLVGDLREMLRILRTHPEDLMLIRSTGEDRW
ncbi:MCE family protein [Candidatus Fermentibacteria bacterium]|nr:MCE family protein [Candidatus Fermentibacteria bacterium]